uniref:Gamma-glutamyltransferase n=1 Tax=Glossina brevipalpis TaxID=37001 RepID=A0A1A9X250_9MUSC
YFDSHLFNSQFSTLGDTFDAQSRYKEKPSYLGTGAIASNGECCAEIGGKILRDGGSAVDAAIATLLCEGVMLPHSLGIGGGFVANIYNKETGKIEILIARETAPAAAHRDMFIAKEITGAIAAATPGEVYGYWCLHQKYGKLPWKTLFKPSIELCFTGHRVTKHLATILEVHRERLFKEATMAEIFINPYTNDLYKENEIMYRPQLGETLKILAEEGPEAMYDGGSIGKMLVEDIQEMGGIITEDDLKNYKVRWEEPIIMPFGNDYTLFTPPLPTSGVVLAFILKVMEPLQTSNEPVYWQRMIEAFKHGYGFRTNLGDAYYEPHVNEELEKFISPEFAADIRRLIKDDMTCTDVIYYNANFAHVEDHGTANLSVIAPNGDAIAITSTVNSHLGAKVRSQQTGIILNDEMDDFSTPGVINTYGIPASPANYVKPGKIPMSSTCPSIVLDKFGHIQLMVGGAGGSKITTGVVQTILRYFILNETIEAAINSGRVHHQLSPMHIDVETTVPGHTIDYLIKVGHELNYMPPDKAFSALTAIGFKTGKPHPVCDSRRLGSTALINFDE